MDVSMPGESETPFRASDVDSPSWFLLAGVEVLRGKVGEGTGISLNS